MLSTAKDSFADFAIVLGEWVVDDSKSALVLNGKPNEHSDCGQVSLDKI